MDKKHLNLLLDSFRATIVDEATSIATKALFNKNYNTDSHVERIDEKQKTLVDILSAEFTRLNAVIDKAEQREIINTRLGYRDVSV